MFWIYTDSKQLPGRTPGAAGRGLSARSLTARSLDARSLSAAWIAVLTLAASAWLTSDLPRGLAASATGPAGGTAGGAAGHAAAWPDRTGQEPPVFRSVRGYRTVAIPIRLRIPAVGIDAPVDPVGLAPDGTIAPPDGWQVAGWYDGGPRPGQDGPAVIVGHVDSRTGPAVFFRLPELRPGQVLFVGRADGSSERFRVTGRLQVAKRRFPAQLVYAPALRASLRLITCAGSFDPATGHYRDNLVITAEPG